MENKNKLIELSIVESKQISGGTNYFAYAMGYIVGRAISTYKGAYQDGYDSAQDQCECD